LGGVKLDRLWAPAREKQKKAMLPLNITMHEKPLWKGKKASKRFMAKSRNREKTPSNGVDHCNKHGRTCNEKHGG